MPTTVEEALVDGETVDEIFDQKKMNTFAHTMANAWESWRYYTIPLVINGEKFVGKPHLVVTNNARAPESLVLRCHKESEEDVCERRYVLVTRNVEHEWVVDNMIDIFWNKKVPNGLERPSFAQLIEHGLLLSS